jgi:hypothetical protein
MKFLTKSFRGFMSYAANDSINFESIARNLGTAQAVRFTSSRTKELVPAEAQSRMDREGVNFLRRPAQNGATVDQEGLTNNYAIEPEMYYALFPSPAEARQYALQGLAAAVFVLGLVATAVGVS